jgi:hypothetical protein
MIIKVPLPIAFGKLDRPWVKLSLLTGSIAIFWVAYIKTFHLISYYGLQEVGFFRRASFWDLFFIMDFGLYKRFSPLGLGIIGYLDIQGLVPLLGRSAEPDSALALAGRLAWVHPIFLAATCAAAGFVTWRLFGNLLLAALAIVFIGFNDAVPFQFRFVSTLACYLLQMSTLFAVYFIVGEGPKLGWRSVIGAVVCIAVSLAAWEQGLCLAISIAIYLVISIWLARREGRLAFAAWQTRLLIATGCLIIGYLAVRSGAGAEEALSKNREASYFFSYKNPLLMVDDLLLNFSGLVEQSIRQLFPFPSQFFAVLLGANMNELNPYNTTYSQFPNMPYRMMGLWFSGFSFAVFWGLVATVVYFMRGVNLRDREFALIALCLLVFGFVMHLPIMHRDYFYIPGYALGYKTSVSYVGFVFVLLFLASRVVRCDLVSGLSARYRKRFVALIFCYLTFSAIVRALVLQVSHVYPW